VTVPEVWPDMVIEGSPAAEAANAKVPAVVAATPKVGVAVQVEYVADPCSSVPAPQVIPWMFVAVVAVAI
jgi:hypothetical protein